MRKLCSNTFFFLKSRLKKIHVGSYFPDQESNPHPGTLEGWSLNHWTSREVPQMQFLNNTIFAHGTGIEHTNLKGMFFFLAAPGPLWNFSCDQGLNLGHGSESTKSLTIGPSGNSLIDSLFQLCYPICGLRINFQQHCVSDQVIRDIGEQRGFL